MAFKPYQRGNAYYVLYWCVETMPDGTRLCDYMLVLRYFSATWWSFRIYVDVGWCFLIRRRRRRLASNELKKVIRSEFVLNNAGNWFNCLV